MSLGTVQALAASLRQAREASADGDVSTFERLTAEQACLAAQLCSQSNASVGDESQREVIAAEQCLARELLVHRRFVLRARNALASLLQASSPNSTSYPSQELRW